MSTVSGIMMVFRGIDKKLLCFLFWFLFLPSLFCITIGSDILPSRQGAVIFSGVDNKMNGFGAFEKGFSFEDENTTCSFDSVFPVFGEIDIKRGSVFLQKDLIFGEGTPEGGCTIFSCFGNFYGGGYVLDFPMSVTYLCAGTVLDKIALSDISILLHGNLSWRVPTLIKNDCVIDGGGNRLSLDMIGSMVVESGGSLTFKNIELAGFSGCCFSCEDDAASVVFSDCKIILDNDFSFEKGSILFDGDVFFTGTNSFVYQSNMTSTIASNSILLFDFDTTFKYDPVSVNQDLLYMVDESSTLFFKGASLTVTDTSLRLLNGKISLDKIVTFSSEGASSEVLCFGNGVASSNVELEMSAFSDIRMYGSIGYYSVD